MTPPLNGRELRRLADFINAHHGFDVDYVPTTKAAKAAKGLGTIQLLVIHWHRLQINGDSTPRNPAFVALMEARNVMGEQVLRALDTKKL